VGHYNLLLVELECPRCHRRARCEVEFRLLSRPRCYADPGRVGVGGDRLRPVLVGIIYKLSRKARVLSVGW